LTGATQERDFTSPDLRPAATFFGAPIADIDDLGPGTIATAGVYCDHFSAGQPGGRFGARQFRYVSTLSGFSIPQTLVDLGDFNVFPLEPQRTCDSLSDQSQRIVASGAKLFAIGGDYSVSPALVRGLARELGSGSLAVVRISRRFDLLAKAKSHLDAPWRCSATYELAEILSNRLSAVALLGGRGTVSAEEWERASAAIVVPASQLVTMPVEAIRRVRNKLHCVADQFFLSIDVDVLAPRFGERALPNSHGGLSVAQLLAVLAALDGMPLVGAELTGHVPDLDVPGRAMTSQLTRVATRIIECLAKEALPCR